MRKFWVCYIVVLLVLTVGILLKIRELTIQVNQITEMAKKNASLIKDLEDIKKESELLKQSIADMKKRAKSLSERTAEMSTAVSKMIKELPNDGHRGVEDQKPDR